MAMRPEEITGPGQYAAYVNLPRAESDLAGRNIGRRAADFGVRLRDLVTDINRQRRRQTAGTIGALAGAALPFVAPVLAPGLSAALGLSGAAATSLAPALSRLGGLAGGEPNPTVESLSGLLGGIQARRNLLAQEEEADAAVQPGLNLRRYRPSAPY